MTVTNVLAGLAVKDLVTAEAWYAKLLERAPDSKPMKEVFEYRFPTGGWLQVFADKDRAGHGSATLVVADLDAQLVKLKSAGISAGAPTRTATVDTSIVKDPDGNQLVFAQSKSATNKATS